MLMVLMLVGIRPLMAQVVSDEWAQNWQTDSANGRGQRFFFRALKEAAFVLETADGTQHQVILQPVGENQSSKWISAADKSGRKPL